MYQLPILDWSHETVLAAEPASATKARDFVCLHLVEHNLRHLVEDIRLVASELATNAMLHARTPFTVTLSETGETLLLVVRDGSTSVPVMTAPQVMDMGGRGLMLVDMLSRDWGASTDGDGFKSVWASFATTGPEPAPVSV